MKLLSLLALLVTSSFINVLVCAVNEDLTSEVVGSNSASERSFGKASRRLHTSSFLSSLSVSSANRGSFRISVLQGLARSRPSCVSWGSGRADCFYRGNVDATFQQTIKDGKASDPVNIGGLAFNDVQCISLGVNQIDCLITNKNNKLMSAYWRGQTWSNWELRAEDRVNEIGRSSCTRRGNFKINCLFRVMHDFPARIGINGNTFFGFVRMSGTYRYPLTCVSRTKDSIDCYSASYGNHLYTIQWRRATGWSKNIPMDSGSYITSEPTSVASSETQNHIFSTSQNRIMIHASWTANVGFSPLKTVGSLEIIESPECVARGTKELYCFALGFDHVLQTVHYDGIMWSTWKRLGGEFLESPSCLLFDANHIYCFARNIRSFLVQIVYTI